MPKKLPPHVERFLDRHRKMRFYYRVGKGSRTPLPSDPASQEFLEAWRACSEGNVPSKAAASVERDPPGSIGALIASYKGSAAYVGLKASSKLGYNSRLDRIRREHGKRLVSQMTRSAIITKVLQPLAETPGAAHDTLKKLRILIRHAIDIGWLDHDPSLKIKRAKLQEVRAWNDSQLATFEAAWPIGSKQRTAFALHLYTGQRVSDIRRMTWADIDRETIRVVQQKTGARLTIALHSELRTVLAHASRKHLTIINTEYGRPFSVKGYGQWMRTAITNAGLPLDCQPHGLRKAAGRRMAEAGCTTRQIMAVLGHKTLAEAERYTRDADQAVQALAAVTRLEDRRRTDIPKPTIRGLGKTAKRKGITI